MGFLGMKKTIVLISGKQGSGKSCLQNSIHEKWQLKNGLSCKVNYADVIYEIHDSAREILSDYYVDERKLPKDGLLLQLLGSEWGRNTFGDDIWVNCTKVKINNSKSTLFIISDCRFENEFYAFDKEKDVQVTKVRLNCPESIRKSRCAAWRENTSHPSEVGMDNIGDDKFNFVFDTSKADTEICSDIVLSKIYENL